jgi:hypothetical protein
MLGYLSKPLVSKNKRSQKRTRTNYQRSLIYKTFSSLRSASLKKGDPAPKK